MLNERDAIFLDLNDDHIHKTIESSLPKIDSYIRYLEFFNQNSIKDHKFQPSAYLPLLGILV